MPKKLVSTKGWKTVQSRVKYRKKIKLALLVLGLLATVLIFGYLARLGQTLLGPWQAERTLKQYFLDDTLNINLVVKTDSLSVLVFNPSKRQATIVKLPDNIFLEVAHGLGKWQLSSVYNLGGGKLLKDSVMSFMAVPIDGFIEFSGPWQKEGVSEFIRQNPISILTRLSYIKTDLTLWELIRLKFGLSQVRFDKVKTLDLLALRVLNKINLADGTGVLVADPIKLDSVLADFSDPQIQAEHQTVAVFNATPYPGLAQEAARIITNLGANVITTANAQGKLTSSQIFGEQSKTLKRLAQIFSYDKISQPDLGLQSSRAQINLIVGEDFYQRMGSQ